jgi:hypothetical protein
MKMTKRNKKNAWLAIMLAIPLVADSGVLLPSSFISDAQARIGHPLTPMSGAGVARRTTRRVVRRSTIYRATLPAGCIVTSINGASYWRCGGSYYQRHSGRYVVVYVN